MYVSRCFWSDSSGVVRPELRIGKPLVPAHSRLWGLETANASGGCGFVSGFG